MVILSLISNVNFDPSKSGRATALPAPMVVTPLHEESPNHICTNNTRGLFMTNCACISRSRLVEELQYTTIHVENMYSLVVGLFPSSWHNTPSLLAMKMIASDRNFNTLEPVIAAWCSTTMS